MSNILELFVCLAIIATGSRAEPLSGDTLQPTSNKHTFIVSIGQNFNRPPDDPRGHVCGGALISRVWVLTTASCFEEGKGYVDYSVYVGNKDLTHSTKSEIKKWVQFDEWFARPRRPDDPTVQSYAENDIAIVQLRGATRCAVVLADVWKISPNLLTPELARWNGVIQTAGWTRFLDGTPPQNILQTDLELVDPVECLTQIRTASGNPYYAHDVNLLCTKGLNWPFAVLNTGDKGSPVFVEVAPDRYQVVAVNLKSVPVTNDITRYPDQRNLHISVHYYNFFIKAVTGLKYL